MAKKRPTKPKKLPPLNAIGLTIVDYVINNTALGCYTAGCCGIDDLAKTMKRERSGATPIVEAFAEQEC